MDTTGFREAYLIVHSHVIDESEWKVVLSVSQCNSVLSVYYWSHSCTARVSSTTDVVRNLQECRKLNILMKWDKGSVGATQMISLYSTSCSVKRLHCGYRDIHEAQLRLPLTRH